MKNITMILISVVLVLVLFPGMGKSQSLKDAQEALKNDITISWKEPQADVTEFQSVEFKGDQMIVTRKSVFKDKRENIQVASIPLTRIDVPRLQSTETTNPEGMYYLSIFTENNQEVIKVSTFYGKDTEDNIVNTYYYTLYSKSLDLNQELKVKLEHLIYLCGNVK